MARRRTKKRTHVGAQNGPANRVPAATSVVSRAPKSMVIRTGAGEVGTSVSQLVKDFRAMMEPGTATRLKTFYEQERKSNRLRDYTTMAGPLGISHLLLFSKSTLGNTNLRLALTPRGPTLHFRVEKYVLCKDIRKAMKHPKGGRKEYLTAPLLVMNNFNSPPQVDGSTPVVPRHLESLTTTIFQSLFPAICPQSTTLSSMRRVLLLNREPPKRSSSTGEVEGGSYIINLRHYAITTKRAGLSRGIRRLNAAEKLEPKGRRGLPNLGKLEDVADYFLDPAIAGGGFTTGSESEAETDAEVEVLESNSRKVTGRKQTEAARVDDSKSSRQERPGVEKRAVKLSELGPRLRLRMIKVEEGICCGKVMWHEFLSKSEDEVKIMEDVWNERRREREERKWVQKENIERKQIWKRKQGKGENEEDEEMAEKVWDSEGSERNAEMDTY
ncbi:hypothetical protein MMC07_000809 [Pseudocyphellaria aurata]|nr:hypothetical protein [Pseudocyphellaria aurata]